MSQATATPTWWAAILGGHPDAHLVRASIPGRERYVALPNADRPTMMIDLALGASIASAVARPGQGKARSLAGRLLKVPGAGVLIRSRLSLESPASTLREHHSELLDTECRLSCTSGPLRPNQKPVVRAIDESETIVAVTKIGWDQPTAALIRTEVQALQRLEGDGFESMVTPSVVAAGDWRGFETMTISALPIDDSIAPTKSADVTMEALSELSSLDRRSVESVADSGFWRRIVDRLDDVARFDAVLEASQQLDIGGFHGDWSPWNTQPSPDGRLLVWDWERHATDVPVGLDLVHYLFQVERFIDKRDPVAARPRVIEQAALLLPSVDVAPEMSDHLVDLYLLEALARNEESSLSTQLSNRRQQLLAALGPTLDPARKAA